MKTLETPVERGIVPVSKSEEAAASSANKRINIPLNIENWKHLPAEQVEQLLWFHQYLLHQDMGYPEAAKAIEYDDSTIFRILKGTYEGNWANIVRAIKTYRAEVVRVKKVEAMQSAVGTCKYVENRVTKRLDWILGYTLGRAGSSLILAEGGMGKTMGGKHWGEENNHGTSVFVECLPIGGAKGLLRQIAEKVGVNKNLNTSQMLEAVVRAFNRTRILILDEIQQHVPLSQRTTPTALEMARRIKDLSGCALAMIGTVRVAGDLAKTPYLYEQIIRRTGKPYYLPDKFEESDVLPIITQFIKKPSDDFCEVLLTWANDREVGRLNYVVDQLTFASKIAHDSKKPLTEDMVLAGHQLRENRSKRN